MAYSSTQQKQREHRHNYYGLVRLNVDIEPWKLLISSKGVNISQSGVLVHITNEFMGNQVEIKDIDTILSVGRSIGIQLECHDIDLPIACVSALVTRKNIMHENAMEVGMAFQSSSDELRSLVHEISRV